MSIISSDYRYARDLDEITAIIDGMGEFLEAVEWTPGKRIRIVNRPSATRDMEAELPAVYIAASGEWTRTGTSLVRQSVVGNDALSLIAEFAGNLELVIIADEQEIRSLVLIAVREALDPDIKNTNTDGVTIPLPRYYGGFANLKGVVTNCEIEDSIENVLAGQFDGRVTFSCDLPIYKQVRLAEGIPTFRVKMSADEE